MASASLHNNAQKYVCLAAGGTGGHVFPALAVAQTLQAQGHRTLLITDRRGTHMVTGTAFATIAAASPFQRGLGKRIGALALLSGGAIMSFLRLLFRRPAVMIGFGGYPSFAPLLMAGLLRIPTLVHEQNAYLGRANRLLASRAGHLALSWGDTANVPDAATSFAAGMPVRSAFFEIAPMRLNKGAPLHLTILGGSLGASIFADIVPAAIAKLPTSIRKILNVTQQCRPEQLDSLRAIYKQMGIQANLAPFFDDVPAILSDSHLVIGRAGASSVAELAAAGRPAILVPLAIAMDDHQSANARQLADVGGAISIAEPDFTAQSLCQEMTKLLSSRTCLAKMGEDARKLAMPDAAHNIADYALTLASRGRP